LGCTVYGPWRIGQKGLLQKDLEDGQVLMAPKPEEGKHMAVLDPSKLKITLPGKDPLLKWNVNTLSGFVTRLFLERNGDTVQTAIKVADLVITLRLDRDKVEALRLYPGKEVNISYDPNKIEWF
jgi:hypothetical protein